MSEKEKLIVFLKRHGKKELTTGTYWSGFVDVFVPSSYSSGPWGDRDLPKSNASKGYADHFTEKTVASALSIAAGYVIDSVVLVSKSKPFEYPPWWGKSRLQFYESQGFWNDLHLSKRGEDGLMIRLMRSNENMFGSLKSEVRNELDELIISICKPALRERLRKGLRLHHGGGSDETIDGLFVDDLCAFARIYLGYFLLGDVGAMKRLNPLKEMLPRAIPVGGSPFIFLVE